MEDSDSCCVWLFRDRTAPDGFVCIEGWGGKGVCNMKVLRLSCNTGEGHNSCAKALTESFRKKGITCDVTDSVRFISPVISTLMAKSHVFIYRYLPALFDWGYRLTEKYTFLYRKGSPIYAFFSLGARKLAKYVQEGGYDAVICTHVIPGVMMTEAKPMCGGRNTDVSDPCMREEGTVSGCRKSGYIRIQTGRRIAV